MTVINDYDNYLRIALESAWGTPPSDSLGHFATLVSLPSTIQQITEMAVPQGERVGTRSANVQKPVRGRRHSEGGLETFFRPDTGGMLLWGAIGGTEAISNKLTWSHDPTVDAAVAVGTGTRKRHVIRPSKVLPSFTIQDFKGSQVLGVPKAYQFPGMRIDGFTISWDATDDTGLIRLAYPRLIGKSYGLGTGDLIGIVSVSPSEFQPIPSWKPTLSKNTVQETNIMTFEGTLANNVARVKSSVGSREDQDQNAGTLAFTGSFTRFLVDGGTTEDYFGYAENATPIRFIIEIVGENLIETVSTVPYYDGIILHMPCMIPGHPVRGERDGYEIETIPFTAYHDPGTGGFPSIGGPLEVIVYNDVADYATIAA